MVDRLTCYGGVGYISGPHAQVELYDAIVAQFNNGSIATISGAGTQPSNKPKHEMDIRIYGSEGELSLDLFYEHRTVHREDDNNFVLDVKPSDGDYACDGPVNRFIELIRRDRVENPSPGEVGARTIQLIEAAYRSSVSGKPEPVQGRES